MGIRITKVMGWGLTNVRYDRRRWKFRDRRINPDSPLLNHSAGTLDDLLAYTKATNEDEFAAVFLEMATRYSPELQPDDCVVFQPEFGLTSVLVIIPPGMKDWRRYDNAIDFHEAKSVKPRVQRLPYAPFPYDGIYMDADTGRAFSERDGHYPQVFQRLTAPGVSLEEAQTKPGALDKLADQLLGIPTWQDAVRRFVPKVPDDVIALAAWGELFTDPAAALQLRPLIYTYWA